MQILIEDVALVLVMAEPREQTTTTPAAAALRHPSFSRRDGRGLHLGLRSRSGGFCLLTSARHWSPYFGCLLVRRG